jgi:hypothetical protein
MEVRRGEMQFFGMRLLPGSTVEHTITKHAVLRITNVSLDASVSAVAINGTRAVLVMQLGSVMEDFAIATLSSNNPQATLDVNLPGPATVTFAIKGNVPVCVCGYQLAGEVPAKEGEVQVAENQEAEGVVVQEVDREAQEIAKVEEKETAVVQSEVLSKKQKKELKKHEQKEGKDQVQKDDNKEGKKKTACKLCQKKFSDPAHLTAHIKNKHAFQHKQKIANLLGKTL